LTYRAAQPAARAIHAALQRTGFVKANDGLIAGELGWHILGFNEGNHYSLFVHWIGIEDEDFLAIQPSLQRGWLSSLFCSAPSSASTLPAKQFIAATLDSLPDVRNLKWLTEIQFKAVYCQGKPLAKSDDKN
jgi:hypothetical protein